MVQQQNGSSHTEILCGPTGKLALMNGQTVSKAFIGVGHRLSGTFTAGAAIESSSRVAAGERQLALQVFEPQQRRSQCAHVLAIGAYSDRDLQAILQGAYHSPLPRHSANENQILSHAGALQQHGSAVGERIVDVTEDVVYTHPGRDRVGDGLGVLGRNGDVTESGPVSEPGRTNGLGDWENS